jgi:hypothetical protein
MTNRYLAELSKWLRFAEWAFALLMDLTACASKSARLFPRFSPYWLSKAHSWATPVLVDELDASLLESSSHDIQCRPARFMRSCFELTNGYNPYCRFVRQLLLTPIK